MKGKRPAFKETICPWIPFIFSVVLSGIVMLLWTITGNIETAYPAFFCFLPMTFFFIAAVVSHLLKQLNRMSDRIDQLEAKKKQMED